MYTRTAERRQCSSTDTGHEVPCGDENHPPGPVRSFPVRIRATAATTSPITEPVTSFQNIQVPPHPGVASTTSPSGNIMTKPHMGPRRYHARGHVVIPTRKPIDSRAA